MRALLRAVLVSGLMAATPATAVEGETCLGEPATIVVTEGNGEGTDGDDVIVVPAGPRDSHLFVDGGDGDDLICITRDKQEKKTTTYVNGVNGTDTVVFRGSAGKEYVNLYYVETYRVRLGKGADTLALDLGSDAGSGVVDGGPGGELDVLDIETADGAGKVEVDLGERSMRIDGSTYVVKRFHRVLAIARWATLTGDGLPNDLETLACKTRLNGGAGDDVLRVRRRGTHSYDGCLDYKMRLYGDEGNDRIRGSMEPDLIIGGPGRDVVDGRGGRDTCVAEVEAECER